MRAPGDVEIVGECKVELGLVAEKLVENDAIEDAANGNRSSVLLAIERAAIASKVDDVDRFDAEEALGEREIGPGLLRAGGQIHEDDVRRVLARHDHAAQPGDRFFVCRAEEGREPAAWNAVFCEDLEPGGRLQGGERVKRRKPLKLDHAAVELSIFSAHDGKVDLDAIGWSKARHVELGWDGRCHLLHARRLREKGENLTRVAVELGRQRAGQKDGRLGETERDRPYLSGEALDVTLVAPLRPARVVGPTKLRFHGCAA
jgi:hypothetical protein